MQSGDGTITLKGVSEKKLIKNRMLADGRYVLKGNPRRGGIAAVYQAYDSLADKNVAIKLFRAVHGSDDVVEESFRRETRALSNLRHPNIVAILDSGIDDETGEHYIAMEWVEQDLEMYRTKNSFRDWSDLYGRIGRPVLEALAFAHTHATIHRDIKPSNILITAQGIPKVCDFGISKIRNFLEPGVTLGQFASLPYAPLEPDDGNYSYSRDVFGFAALCVSLLSPQSPKDHVELAKSLESLTIDPLLKRLLRHCLSIDAPSDRPVTAGLLLAQIERLTPKPIVNKQGVILVSLTKKVKDILNIDLAITKEIDAQNFVISDLTSAKAVLETGERKPMPDGTLPIGRAVRLFGNTYGYIAVMEHPSCEKLVLVSALEYSTSQIEDHRENSLELPYSLHIGGVTPFTSEQNIKQLQEILIEFAAEQKSVQLERRSQGIYTTWLNLLHAKTELERQRKHRIIYDRWEESGSSVRFILPEGMDKSSMDDQDIRVEIPSGREFTGTVVSAINNSLLVMPNDRNRTDVTELPECGTLIVDTTKADAALSKQKAALDAVRYGRSVNPLLGASIISPRDLTHLPPTTVDYIQENIDEDKKEAIQIALSNPDLLLIQGPPGTGKTTFITELILQILRKEPDARILLTSQTHVALDNSLERITSESENRIEAVRIGNENDEKISPSTKWLLVDNKLSVLRKSAIAQGKQFIEKWATDNDVDITYARMAMALERHAALMERSENAEQRIIELRPILAEKERNKLEADERADKDQELNDLVKEKDSLLKEMKESFAEIRKHESDKDTLEHLANCSVAELRDWAVTYSPNNTAAAQLRTLLSAHSDWEIRFGRTREFRAALIASSQVVAGTCLGVMNIPGRQEIQYDLCIVDEASIATPTEVLVPMSRARRTILVGDSKQLSPFQDPELQKKGLLQQYKLTAQDQKATLFNHLAELLPPSLKKSLTTQHRMLPAIGNLISDCFYEQMLKSIPRKPKGFLDGSMRKPVVWFSTSKFANRKSQKIGTTYINGLEVEQIIGFLNRANFALTKGKSKGKKMSIAVLTGYGAQKDRLSSAIELKLREWEGFSNIFVNVVDAFQGREADMVIFSVTRSDEGGLGFLQEMERINVALSRGKEYLVIIGDHVFCQEADSKKNPLKNVLDYIRSHPDDCALDEVVP